MPIIVVGFVSALELPVLWKDFAKLSAANHPWLPPVVGAVNRFFRNAAAAPRAVYHFVRSVPKSRLDANLNSVSRKTNEESPDDGVYSRLD